MTPGPVLSSATFIGYLVAGLPGAAVSTVAVFLPAFFIVALVGPWIPRLRRSRVAQAFLRGVNAAVVALIPSTGSRRRLAVSLALFRSAIVDVWTVLIMVAGLANSCTAGHTRPRTSASDSPSGNWAVCGT